MEKLIWILNQTTDRPGDKTPNKNKGHDMGYNTTRADERHLGRGGARNKGPD